MDASGTSASMSLSMKRRYTFAILVLVSSLSACKKSKPDNIGDCLAVSEEIGSTCLASKTADDNERCAQLRTRATVIVEKSAKSDKVEAPEYEACVGRITRYSKHGCMNEPVCDDFVYSRCSDDGLAVESCMDVDDNGCMEIVRKECGSLGCSLAPWGDSSSGLDCRPINPRITKSGARSSGPQMTWGILTPGESLPDGFVKAPKTWLTDTNGRLVAVFKTRAVINVALDTVFQLGDSRQVKVTGRPATFEDYGDGYITFVVPFDVDVESASGNAKLEFNSTGVRTTINAPLTKTSETHVPVESYAKKSKVRAMNGRNNYRGEALRQ